MRRQPGRPPLDDDDDSVDVHLTLPARQYDQVYAAARDARTSVQEVIRQRLRPATPQFRNPK